MSQGARTLFEKVWESHVVVAPEGEPALLYIDLHLLHEVTSPQAFEGLRLAGRTVRRPDRAVATVDHNVPTTANRLIIEDAIAAKQMDALRANCAEFGIPLYDVQSAGTRDRACHRSGARRYQAGHDHRLRRQPHQHPWRIRRAGFRHRHFGSGARSGHPVPAAIAAQNLPHHGGRRAGPSRDGERYRPGHHRPHRNRRRQRLCDRVCRSGHSCALHGRAA